MTLRETKLVDKVLSMNRAVRYCSIINLEGKVITGRMKRGVQSLEPQSETPRLIMQLAVLLGTDKDWDEYLGPTDYFSIRKAKVNLVPFPIKGLKGVLVSTEPSLSRDKLDEIRKAIDRHEKN